MDVTINTVSTDADGNLVVSLTLPISTVLIYDRDGHPRPRTAEEASTPEAHTITIMDGALANRRELYGLATYDEALQMLICEQASRLNALPAGTDIAIHRGSALVSPEAQAIIFAPVTVEAEPVAEMVAEASAPTIEDRMARIEAMLAQALAGQSATVTVAKLES
jgi:hypothetical protein